MSNAKPGDLTAKEAASEPRFVRTTLRMFAGVLIWAAHFLLIYTFTALACTRDLASSVVPVIIAATGLGVLGAALIARSALPPRGFADWLAVSVASIAILAMMWEALPLLWIPVCASR